MFSTDLWILANQISSVKKLLRDVEIHHCDTFVVSFNNISINFGFGITKVVFQIDDVDGNYNEFINYAADRMVYICKRSSLLTALLLPALIHFFPYVFCWVNLGFNDFYNCHLCYMCPFSKYTRSNSH